MQGAKEKFLMREYHFMIHKLGIKVAVGHLLTKKEVYDVKKAIALYKDIGYSYGINEAKQMLIQSLKNKKTSHLTLIKE